MAADGPHPSPCPHTLRPQWMVFPNRRCSPSYLSDVTTVAKPETWASSLAFPSLTSSQLVTVSDKISFLTPCQICPLIFTFPASGHIISHQNDCNDFLTGLPACSLPSRLTLAHTPLIFHTAARRTSLVHKSHQGNSALAQLFPCFPSAREEAKNL